VSRSPGGAGDDRPLARSPIQAPQVVRGPWTLPGRQLAVEKECLQLFIEYFGKAMQTRRWSPWHDLPLGEMQAYGDRLSPETIHLIEGFYGIEEYLGDYVLDAMEIFGHQRTRRNLQLQWASDELKHGAAWELTLVHSGARTEQELEEYYERLGQHRFSIRSHPGADDALGIAIYVMVQERATYFNYRETRARVREEYGLPATPTDEERARGREVGASEAFRVVGLDEIAHHGIFLRIVAAHLKYLPDQTLEAMDKVLGAFRMPGIRLIPNAREFIRAVTATGLHTREKHSQLIRNPILQALGLEGDEAFNRAVQAAKLLPAGLGPDQVRLGKTGEFVIACS
jgi:acyl-[acyl-carrier-protein] desaturase